MTKRMQSIFCLLLCMVLVLGLAACKSEKTGSKGSETTVPGGTTGAKTVYTVRILNQTDVPLAEVGVYIYEDSSMKELVWYDTTNEAGEMTFEDVQRDTYVAVLEDVPVGYEVEEYYPLTDLITEIVLETGTMTGEEDDIVYELGDMVMDFSVTDTDGNELTLSELLKSKDAVVLNFYYNGCVPCQMEFPYLQEAYLEYSEKIAVIAMNPMDDGEAVAQFKQENGLTFPMVACSPNWEKIMKITAYPTTVVIDRLGNIVLKHTGSVDSAQTFKDVFEAVSGDDYEQKIFQGLSEVPVSAEEGSKENPKLMGPTPKFQLTIEGGKEHFIEFLRLNNLTLRIEDPDAYVIYKDKKYTPQNGVVSLLVDCPDMNTPMLIGFGNSSDKTKAFTVTMSAQPGSQANPYKLVEGDNKVKINAGNEQGVYYTWTAKANGSLQVWCITATPGVEYDCILYNLTSYAQRSLNGEGKDGELGRKYVEVLVNKGDKVQMIAAVMPDENWNYPAGNFTYVAEFVPGEGRNQEKVDKTTYTVTVTDEKKQPLTNVHFYTQVDNKATSFATNAEGVATIDLPTGEYKVTMIIPEGYTSEVTEFTLNKANPKYSVVLKEKIVVMTDYTVIVNDPNGVPMENVTVIIGDKFAVTDKDGKITMNLEQADYAVQVTAPEGYSTTADSYTFPEGESTLTVALEYKPGTENNPVDLTEDLSDYSATVVVPGGSTVYYCAYRVNGMLMSINGGANVTCTTADILTPYVWTIENDGADVQEYTITLSYPLGHRQNPQILESLGQLQTDLAEGDEDGYYYHWTAQEEGFVAFYIQSATEGVVADISLTNTTNSSNKTLSEDGKGNLVTLNVMPGDVVQIQVLGDQKAAQIVSVGSFTAQENTEDTKITYSVIVKNAEGEPMANVPVTIGVTELITDENGIAFAQLVAGIYTAKITVPDGYKTETAQVELTSDAPQAEVVLSPVVMVDYTVKLVLDDTIYTGETKVQIQQNGVTVYEQTVTNGTVTANLPEGDYTVKLTLTDSKLLYDVNNNKLSTAVPSLTVVLTRAKTYTNYKVTVVDANNNVQSGILVQILNGNTVVASGNTDTNGQFTSNLETGNYTVELKFSGTNHYYNKQTAVLSSNAAALTIRLASELDTTKYDTHWLVNDEKIYKVGEGITHVQIGAGKPYSHVGTDYTDCLFLFQPARLGLYTITVDYKGGEVRSYSDFVGNVMDQSSNYDDGIFCLDYKYQSQLNNKIPVIFGIQNVDGVTDACITITRIGEPGFDISNLPVSTDWYSGYVPVKQSTPSGTVKYINIKASTDTYDIYYDETAKVYKVMVNGVAKTLYMNLGTVTTQNISLNTVVNGDGLAGGSPLRKYLYDSNGNIIAKEEYTDVIKQYIDCADANRGLYPVTKDLAYIVQNAKPGWWDSTSPDYLLEGCNPDLGWLFACCYIQ